MTRPGCGRKTKKGKHRKHTPYKSEAQATAGNIALAVKKGKLPKSKLKVASKQMHRGMTLEELESHSKEVKGKKLPKRKRKPSPSERRGKPDRYDRADLKARKKQRNRRAG